MSPLFILFTLLAYFAYGAIVPPPNTLIVSLTPSSGQFSSIQAALNSLSLIDPTPQYILIKAGHYHESVLVKPRKALLTIQGEIRQGGDDYYYRDNLVTISHNSHAGNGFTNDDSATLRVHMDGFTLRNVNIVNEYLQGGAQALALSAVGDRQSYLGSSFTSYIDTIENEKGDQFFGGCYIEGAIDILFGRTATAFYHDCDLAITAKKHGWITASGRITNDLQGEIVIDSSRINAKTGVKVLPGSIFLGRPWGSKAIAAVQSSYLSEIVNTAGWDRWPGNSNDKGASFFEYNNRGPGAAGKRAGFSHPLTKAISISQLFKTTNWIDPRYTSA